MRNIFTEHYTRSKNGEKILLLIFFIIILFSLFHFYDKIFEYLNTILKFQKIEIWKFIAGIGVFYSLYLAFHRLKISDKNLRNQTKQIASDKFSRQNQQFLDAIKLFDESKSLESKKGALFHLENLAISSPAHRQRVLDFLNSLNSWMRDYEAELSNLNTTQWEEWRNKKKILLQKNTSINDEQILSAEITQIYENIIRKHNNQYPLFSEKEKLEYALNFSYFIFARINFRYFTFTQSSNFSNCLFLGTADFQNTLFLKSAHFRLSRFKNGANFNYVNFLSISDFWNTSFLCLAHFHGASFLGTATFIGAIFNEIALFIDAKFQNDAFFSITKFNSIAIFSSSKFKKDANFNTTSFNGEIYFDKTDFSSSSVKAKNPLLNFKKDYFMSSKIYEKIKNDAIFNNEQMAHFEKENN